MFAAGVSINVYKGISNGYRKGKKRVLKRGRRDGREISDEKDRVTIRNKTQRISKFRRCPIDSCLNFLLDDLGAGIE